ncbi:MAG: NADH-quinone oxidoreductase subunit L [Halothiobacillus sp. 14-55-98]|jgi:NAD(P)H-quinone oxidoreductase subunit 5|nr:MAG: NADH-quinone oxidoreductase subunit L [Halothiobacillus sp. 14-55-98]
MSIEFSHTTGLLLLAMPTLLLIAAAIKPMQGAVYARAYRQRIQWASLTAFGLALLAVISFLFAGQQNLVLGAGSLPAGLGLLALSVQVNGLTLVLASLVSFVLSVIARYSVQYLDGDPQQARFFRLLAVTGGFFLSVVITGNLGLFTLAIIATGFGLHRLLSFYADRPRAIMATHKKSIFSRTADALLLAATVLIGHQVGSLEFSQISAYVHAQDQLSIALHVAAWLIVLAAILKSAQFPFHGWLIQVMEAPTPVSALMHAGVVYSGAIIVLRTSELLAADGTALVLLALFGLMTLAIGSLVMLTQSAIKSSLAWSTAAQLGFMMLELGLGLFGLALLHLVGHSLYKAHAFLSSGSMTDHLRQAKVLKNRPISVVAWFTTVIVSGLFTLGIAAAMGLSIDQEPMLPAVLTIIALATAQLMLKALSHGTWREILVAAGAAIAMTGVYVFLHEVFITGFADTLAATPQRAPLLDLLLMAITIITFLFVAWLQGPGKTLMSPERQFALFVHLNNGLYLDRWVERLAFRFWPEKVGRAPKKSCAVIPPNPSGIEP